MGQGIDEARRQRELSKHALASDLDRLQARVRAELDWRTRLRRDGPRLAAVGVALIVVAGVVLVLRSRLRRDHKDEAETTSLEELSAELRELRRSLEKQNGKSSSLVQKALLRGVTAAGSAGGTMLARRMLQQQPKGEPEGAERPRAG